MAQTQQMDFKPIDNIIEHAIADGKCPNADLVIGRAEEILYEKVYGRLSVDPEERPMMPGMVFDLASLTKPMATATSIMILHERGKLNVKDPVAKYMPSFAINGKEAVTIEQCLLHTAGFIPDNPLKDYTDGGGIAVERVKALSLKQPPGEKFVYSDVGYIVLGELVRVVDGRTLDVFAAEEIYRPLGMSRTTFKPDATLAALCVPTEKRDGRFTPGQVHDPRAYAMGGVAGHAGLFATAADVATYCRMIVGGGAAGRGQRILKSETIAEMIKPRPAPDEKTLRTYGFDCVSSYDSPRGKHFTKGKSFGHTGYTGGSVWIDPDTSVWVVLLTSRVYPDGKGDVKQLRHDVATAAAEIVGVVRR